MLCFVLQAHEGDFPLVPPRRGEQLYMVPQGIRPVVQLTAVEVPHLLLLAIKRKKPTKFKGLLMFLRHLFDPRF